MSKNPSLAAVNVILTNKSMEKIQLGLIDGPLSPNLSSHSPEMLCISMTFGLAESNPRSETTGG